MVSHILGEKWEVGSGSLSCAFRNIQRGILVLSTCVIIQSIAVGVINIKNDSWISSIPINCGQHMSMCRI